MLLDLSGYTVLVSRTSFFKSVNVIKAAFKQGLMIVVISDSRWFRRQDFEAV